MQKKGLLFFLILLFGANAFAQLAKIFDPSEHAKIEHSEKRYWAARMDGNIQLAPTADYDVKYHRFRWNIDPRIKYIEGSVMTLFEVTGSSFQTIHFDLNDSLRVDSIHYHNTNLSISQPSDNILSINLPANVPQNALDSITVFYHGVPPDNGFGSFEVRSHGDTTFGFDSALWTLSEPYGSRDWWPGKMTLNDKIDSIDIYITLPSQYTVATNGLPVDTVYNGNLATHHWKHRYPIANYLICLAASNYVFVPDTVLLSGVVMPLYNFWYPELAVQWIQGHPDYHGMLRLYTSLFGNYPFLKEKYGHAQMLEDGGMEHQTMTFVSDDDFEVVAHEMAHHWFGDKLTCDSWQEIWLNEGFATYCTAISYEYLTDPINNYYHIYMAELHDNVIKYNPSGSVYVDDTTSVDRIFSASLSYDKGASILHMLRWKLGDQHFFNALKSYIADPNLAYSFTGTDNLKSHLEQESGLSLTSFFTKWYYGQGYPTYLADWAQNGDKLASVKLGQTTSDPSVSFYEMPVEIHFKNAVKDTMIVVNDSINNQLFNVQLSFTADSVLIDPNNWILRGKSIITKVSSLNAVESVVLLPNPFINSFQVWYNPATINIQSIVLYNIMGQELKNIIPDKSISTIISVDTPGFAPGIYLLRVNTTEGYVARKLVKQ